MASKFPMGPGNPPPRPPAPQIDLSQAANVSCSNCGNYTFTEVNFIKHVSAILSPSGKEGFVPVPTFACNACGFVPDQFLPSFMRPKEELTPEKPKVEEPVAAPTPSPTKIEIVR